MLAVGVCLVRLMSDHYCTVSSIFCTSGLTMVEACQPGVYFLILLRHHLHLMTLLAMEFMRLQECYRMLATRSVDWLGSSHD